uniref:starch-binding protein n=1 Tax=Acetatifactor sp. TaxID=1872090 RepID=UPI00405629BF
MKKRLVSILLSAICIVSAVMLTGCGSEYSWSYEPDKEEKEAGQVYDFGLADTVEEGAILHAFSWSFAAIKESMADIAAAGFSAIQTSPINACYDGDAGGQLYGDGKWYYHYQATDYAIGNYQLGTREEFIAMCDEADKYGIKIIVDVAPNHTTTNTDYISENLLNAVGGMENLFHTNGLNNITSYSDRLNCTTHALSGLPDIDTENPDYQQYLIAYLNDCIACGADGFRFDAAKHIGLIDDPGEDEQECNFWNAVLGGLDNREQLFTYGEVLQGDGERIESYINTIGAATASSYGTSLRKGMKLANILAGNLDGYLCGDSTDVVLWVESHDNYINDNTSQMLTDREVELAWAMIASRSEGTPLFFDRPYGSTKENPWGTVNEIGVAGNTFYKSDIVSAVNHFRNAMIGEEEHLKNPADTKKVLLIERGEKGLVIVNIREEYQLEIGTNLADGTYIDRVDKVTEYIVKDGKLSCTVPEESVIVLYNEGYRDMEPLPEVSAEAEEYYALSGESVEVTLHVSGAAEGVYVLGDGEEVSYTDGTVITVGDILGEGDSMKLTVKATNESGFTSAMSYYFTKVEQEEEVVIVDGMTVYFEKPSYWGDVVYAYIYDDSDGGLKILKDWPGNVMKDEGDGIYSYTFERDWSTGVIMFSDGKNQYPKSNEPGTSIEADKVYTVN